MQTISDQPRTHFWDSLRAFLMLLGIPYHVALSYQPHQDFIVHSGEGVPGFPALAQAVHLFRMPAFFVIAGYFALLLVGRRKPTAWLKSRFVRLGLPFITCIVTLVPLMNLACEMSAMPFHEALRSWRHNSLTSGGYWVRHLWFIIVLLYFSSVVTFLATRLTAVHVGALPARVDMWASQNFLTALMVLAAAIGAWEALALEAFYKVALATMWPQQVFRLDETIIYAPWFTAGAVLVRAPRMLERATRISLPVILVAVVAAGIWLLVHDNVAPMTERFIGSFAALAITQALIANARTLLDRPIPLVRRLTAASFVIYLFHLPLITLFVWLAQPLPVPPLVKAMAITGLTLGLSYGIWAAITRMRAMSLLFEGVVLPRARPVALPTS